MNLKINLIELPHVTSGVISQVKTPTLAVYVHTAVPFPRLHPCCDIVFHLQLPHEGAICDLLWSDTEGSSFGRDVVSQLCVQHIGIDSVSGLLPHRRGTSLPTNCRAPRWHDILAGQTVGRYAVPCVCHVPFFMVGSSCAVECIGASFAL